MRTWSAGWLVLLLPIARALAVVTRSYGGEEFESFAPVFVATQLTPKQFIIVSSPTEQKIVYAQLKNFKSITGRSYALIDSGLSDPRGIALDREKGALYVADIGARKIFRYRVYVEGADLEGGLQLTTDGIQVTVLQDHSVEWVAVDINSDLFFSDEGSKTIGRIPEATLSTLAEGYFQAGELTFVSEKTMEAEAIRQRTAELQGTADMTPTDRPAYPSTVFTIYEGSINPHVTTPGGVASDGMHLYWTNLEDGNSAGTVVRGEVNPKPPMKGREALPFPATALSNNSLQAFGVVKSSKMVLWSTNSSGIGKVYGMMESTGQVTTFVGDVAEPRGLVWDGDQTVYVADKGLNAVFSFPVGRLIEFAPVTKAVVLNGAFGVALLSETDKAWTKRSAAHAVQRVSYVCGVLVLLLAGLSARV